MLNYVATISDLHIGCRLGLCHPSGAKMDGGGTYVPSPVQKWMWNKWLEYWKWITMFTKGEPYAVVVNGDDMDGSHHNSTTQFSHNLSDQAEAAYQILSPVVDKCKGNFYMVRGTPAHSGESAEESEKLAKRLGISSVFELKLLFGEEKYLNAMHHIGGTSSVRSKATSVMAELSEIWANSGRWGSRIPDVIVRSHRHEYIKVEMASSIGDQFIYVTPAWQLKTPFGQMLSGARTATPQVGGCLVTYSPKKKKIWVDKKVDAIEPPKGEFIRCNTKPGQKHMKPHTK